MQIFAIYWFGQRQLWPQHSLHPQTVWMEYGNGIQPPQTQCSLPQRVECHTTVGALPCHKNVNVACLSGNSPDHSKKNAMQLSSDSPCRGEENVMRPLSDSPCCSKKNVARCWVIPPMDCGFCSVSGFAPYWQASQAAAQVGLVEMRSEVVPCF